MLKFLSKNKTENSKAAPAVKHLVSIQELEKDFISDLVKTAKGFERGIIESEVKDKTAALMFCENSTRTKVSFEMAAKNLGMRVIHFDAKNSSFTKGESLKDTLENLYSTGIEAAVIRHSTSGIIDNVLGKINCPMSLINAGDGHRAHPTQALLDFYTMTKYFGDVKGKKITIIGDIKHSRVAHSNIVLLKKFGADVHVCSPSYFGVNGYENYGVTSYLSLEEAIEGADAIMCLRIQAERHSENIFPSVFEYTRQYKLSGELVEKYANNAVILHPGPANPDVELTSELIGSNRCKAIQEQVKNGVYVRMAVLNTLLKKGENKNAS